MTPEASIPLGAKCLGVSICGVFMSLGLTQGMLVSALMGAMLSLYYTPIDPPRKIPQVIFGIVAVAFAGAWTARLLPFFAPMSWTGAMPPEALAGFLAMTMQFSVPLGKSAVQKFVAGRFGGTT